MIKHFPFTGETFKAQMGLKILELRDWLEPDENLHAQTALKARLIAEHGKTVLDVQDEDLARPAALELVDLIRANMAEYHSSVALPAPRPLITASEALTEIARLVQEDFCLLSPRDYTLMAGLVCFPSRWKLPDKIGKSSDGIHQPVEHFKPIAKPTAGALAQLSKPLARVNWTIHDADELFAPEAVHRQPVFPEGTILERTFLRLERQTLRRLPVSNAIAFSIRTYITPISEVARDLSNRNKLRATLQSLPTSVAEYKGMRYYFEDLKAALAR